jgi:hypothetical protein
VELRLGSYRVRVSSKEELISCSQVGAPGKRVWISVASTSIPDSKVFRARAKECREIADLCQSENPRNLVLEVADKYDRLADQAASMELQQADKTS